MTPQKLSRRYRSGYRVGGLINGLGLISKAIGLLLGFALCYLGFEAAKLIEQNVRLAQWVSDHFQVSAPDQQALVLGGAVALAIVLLFLFWLVGTFVSAVGQILKAILDTAVNTSPFLSSHEKQHIVS